MEGEKMRTNNSFGWIYSEEDQRNGVVAGWQDPTKTEILEQAGRPLSQPHGLWQGRSVGGVGGVDQLAAPAQTWPDPANSSLLSSPIKALLFFRL